MPLIVGEFIPHDSSLQFKTLNHLHADVLKAPFALPESASKRTTHQIARSSHFDPSGHFRGELASRKRTFTQSGATEACDQSPLSLTSRPALHVRNDSPGSPRARNRSSRSHSSTLLEQLPQGTPNSEQLTAYAKAHLVAYLRLLDADAARADWQTSCHSMPPQSCDPTSWCTTRLRASTLDDVRHLILK
jgi:hypothetical protein